MKQVIVTLAVFSLFALACGKKNDAPPPTAPRIATAQLTNITTTSATAGGVITSDGGGAIIKAGVVFSKTNATPTITTDSIATTVATSGSFTVNLSNLDFGTTFYVRAFATNSAGTGYGDIITLNTTNDTTKVRFTYMGQTVTYGIIVSSTTGKKWLDRNLGASRVAIAYNDDQAYGDYFQWGRLADGHQIKTSDSVRVFSSTDIPGHNKFIVSGTFPDWRNPYNDNLWQGSTGINNPCPSGWHVPTGVEWTAEAAPITDFSSAFSVLKLTMTGYRGGVPGIDYGINSAGTGCYYWSSTPNITPPNAAGTSSQYFRIVPPPRAPVGNIARINGLPVRCIKD